MQTVYIADLPLENGDVPANWREVSELVESWIRDRIGVDLTADVHQGTRPDGAAEARRQLLVDPETVGARLLRWDVRRLVPENPQWQYVVTVWLSDADGSGKDLSARCRLAVHSTGGQVVQPDVPLGRPRVVGDLLRNCRVQMDGRRLGVGETFGTSDIPTLVELLTDPSRRLPVVVLTPSPRTGRPLCSPDTLASALGGLAHVAVLAARTTTFAFTDALGGPSLAVFNGAVRLYWPSFSLEDSRQLHPLWTQTRQEQIGARPFVDQLFARVGRVSAIALGAPDLERDLLARRARQQQSANARRLQELQRRLADATEAAAARARPVAEDEAWLQEFEQALTAAEEAANERDALQVRVEELEDELAAVRRALAEVSSAVASASDMPAESTAELPDAPTTVLEAVEIAAADCQHLVFLPEAFSSAADSQFDDPELVLSDLRKLDQLVADWRAGQVPQGFKAACAERGLSGYRDGIGQIASTRFEKDYRRTYLERDVMLGPHLRHGIGAPTAIMRIYWFTDTENQAFVIGHVGKKLRDDGNN
jgi:hypothetical protein